MTRPTSPSGRPTIRQPDKVLARTGPSAPSSSCAPQGGHHRITRSLRSPTMMGRSPAGCAPSSSSAPGRNAVGLVVADLVRDRGGCDGDASTVRASVAAVTRRPKCSGGRRTLHLPLKHGRPSPIVTGYRRRRALCIRTAKKAADRSPAPEPASADRHSALPTPDGEDSSSTGNVNSVRSCTSCQEKREP